MPRTCLKFIDSSSLFVVFRDEVVCSEDEVASRHWLQSKSGAPRALLSLLVGRCSEAAEDFVFLTFLLGLDVAAIVWRRSDWDIPSPAALARVAFSHFIFAAILMRRRTKLSMELVLSQAGGGGGTGMVGMVG